MSDSPTSSSFLRRALAWVIIAAVVVLAFKLVIALVVGVLSTVFAVVVVGLAIYAVVWAMRHL